ncbi:PREDICTED: chloride channel CLIC-like protein 1 [Nanorana parkeri]|uniref:chloride channel CLIC-like protein 1 n=1 Tax=Nanorana parkeri TaxID=125878 RepID=UPI0008542732|nr:PREDICTED: chloride channel CLIC-like protein 1 [Nanorana parkeri]
MVYGQQTIKMHLFLLLLFCLVTCSGKHQDDEWIDPTDMLNYDAAAGRMKQQKRTHKIETEQSKKRETPQSTCSPVFKRFLHRILNEAKLLGLPDESQPEVHYNAELVLTKQMVAEFFRFLEGTDCNPGPLDEALGGTLVRFRHHNEEEWRWKFEEYIGTDPFSVFMIALSLLCIVMVVATELWTRVSWFTQIKRLLALCFLVSLVWNWMYLYKDAFAERQAKLAKIGNDNACGKKVTWSDSLFEWWRSSTSFQNDPCEEYFKALMVNPILLVPPTKAFAVTFTNFITEPLKHIGKGIGEFFHALLAEMPLIYQPLVLIIIALLLLVFCYGFGTTAHRINVLRRHRDEERERLPPPNPQREGYDRFIEGGDDRFYNNPRPIQPRNVEGYRDALNRRPEVLHPVDYIDNSRQQFIEPVSASQQPQKKQVAPAKRTYDPHIRDESSGQQQKIDDPLDQRHLTQQPMKKLPEDSPLGSQDLWEDPVKDSEDRDKISPIHRDFSSSHTEVKENVLPDVQTSQVSVATLPASGFCWLLYVVDVFHHLECLGLVLGKALLKVFLEKDLSTTDAYWWTSSFVNIWTPENTPFTKTKSGSLFVIPEVSCIGQLAYCSTITTTIKWFWQTITQAYGLKGKVSSFLFIEPVSASHQPQKNQVAPAKRTYDPHIRDESSGQQQKIDDPLDQRHLSQQPMKKLPEDSPLGSQDLWEESVKDSEHRDKISPIHRDFSSSHTEVKENVLPDVQTSQVSVATLILTHPRGPQHGQKSVIRGHLSDSCGRFQTIRTFCLKSQLTEEEVKVRNESTEEEEEEEEKDQQLIEDGPKDQLGNSPRTVITGSEDTALYFLDLNVVDLYTDPGNAEQS